jgi:hypothetical protein
VSSSFAATSSFADSFTVAGEIVAQTLNVQQVTSSVVYSSGSNIFGNDISNTQQFTGSLQVSGSNHYMIGNLGLGTDSPAGKLNIAATGADGLLLSPDLSDANNSARIFFTRTGGEGWALMNNASILSVRSGAIPGTTSGTQKLGITTDGVATFSCQVCIGTSSTVTGTGLLKLGIASDNQGAALQFLGWAPASGYKSWQIDTAYIGSDTLNFTPSTTGGGTTFTTPVLSIESSGKACFANTVCAPQLRICSTGDLSYVYNSGASTTDANFYISNPSSDILMARNSGCVGIGTANPQARLDIAGNNNALGCTNTLRFTDTDTATELNQQIGKIEFYSSDISTPGAGVKAYIGAFASDTTPDAYLSFATQDGSLTPDPVERLRITSEGNLQVGYSGAPNIAGKLFISRGDQYGLTINAFSGGNCITSTDDNIYFTFGANPALRMICNLISCFAGTVCAPSIVTNGIGIGTASPNNLLEVGCTNICFPSVIVRSQAGYLPTLMLARGDGTFSTTGNSNWLIANSDSGFEISKIDSLDTSTVTRCSYLQITSTGDVGIGVENPGSKLEIRGLRSATKDSLLLLSKFDYGTTTFYQNYSNTFYTNGKSLEVAVEAFPLLQLATNNEGNAGKVIFPNGNVGIGISSPSYKLEVCGPGEIINIIGASSGDISTGFRIGRGASLGAQIYDNPQDNFTTINAAGGLNLRTGNSGRLSILSTGTACFTCTVVANRFETIPGQSGLFGIYQNGSEDTNYRFFQFSTSGCTYVINTQMGACGEYDIWQYSTAASWQRNFRMTTDAVASFRGNILPMSNGTQDLGSSSLRWCTVYTSDLSLNNGIGNYTIVEGQNDLFIYNNNSCKVYKFLLQEVCPEIAPAKRSI